MTSYTPTCRECAAGTGFYAVACEGCKARARAKGVALKAAAVEKGVAKMARSIEAEIYGAPHSAAPDLQEGAVVDVYWEGKLLVSGARVKSVAGGHVELLAPETKEPR